MLDRCFIQSRERALAGRQRGRAVAACRQTLAWRPRRRRLGLRVRYRDEARESFRLAPASITESYQPMALLGSGGAGNIQLEPTIYLLGALADM